MLKYSVGIQEVLKYSTLTNPAHCLLLYINCDRNQHTCHFSQSVAAPVLSGTGD